MIGVYCSEAEKIIVQEFFELFKTPWEFFNSSTIYDVFISTQHEMPEVSAGLIIIYSSSPVRFDVAEAIRTRPTTCKNLSDHNETLFPVYGDLLSFQGRTVPLLYSEPGSEVIAIEILQPLRKVIRVGFNLFQEVAFLLSAGQPVENALFPTLEAHISTMRNWVLSAGIPLVEIPPFPSGYSYFACLTHDIDFIGIRRHKFDRTMWGFVYRGLIGSLLSFLRGGTGLKKLTRNWVAVFKLPFVYAGLVDDFWQHFDKYAEIDNGFGSTFFVIPYKNREGDNLDLKKDDHSRRAAPYGIDDVGNQVKHLLNLGHEVGLHGIDAWHSIEKGTQERDKIAEITQKKEMGIRMHWLYYNQNSPVILEKTGFSYDASLGYNDAIGFKNGTMQVFRPFGVHTFLEIPLNIQDTALFYPRRLDLKDSEANQLCEKLLNAADCHGGVLTLSWHDRSLEPERLWGDFYVRLLREIQSRGAWIGSARQIVNWFRQRRSVLFEESYVVDGKLRLKLKTDQLTSGLEMFLRFYIPSNSAKKTNSEKDYQNFDIPLNGQEFIEMPLKHSEVA